MRHSGVGASVEWRMAERERESRWLVGLVIVAAEWVLVGDGPVIITAGWVMVTERFLHRN